MNIIELTPGETFVVSGGNCGFTPYVLPVFRDVCMSIGAGFGAIGSLLIVGPIFEANSEINTVINSMFAIGAMASIMYAGVAIGDAVATYIVGSIDDLCG